MRYYPYALVRGMDTKSRIYLKAMKTLAAQGEMEPAPKRKATNEAMRRSAKVLKAGTFVAEPIILAQLSSGTSFLLVSSRSCV